MTGKQFATLVIITFIVGMVWLISDIIFNTKASVPVSEKLETLLSPVNPTFNQRLLDSIDKDVTETNLTTPALRDAISAPVASTAPIPLSSSSPLPSLFPSPLISPSPLALPSQPLVATSGAINP